MPNLKRIGGGEWKPSVDLTWNDPANRCLTPEWCRCHTCLANHKQLHLPDPCIEFLVSVRPNRPRSEFGLSYTVLKKQAHVAMTTAVQHYFITSHKNCTAGNIKKIKMLSLMSARGDEKHKHMR